jgi:hypothetical protein
MGKKVIGNFLAEKKWGFLLLSILSLVVLIFLVSLFWYLISPRLDTSNPFLSLVVKIILFLFLITVSGGLSLIVLSSALEKDFLFPHGEKQITLKVLFPINIILGKFFGLSKDEIRKSFIEVNNSLFKATRKRINKDRLLVLLPQCLQNYDCPYRVITNLNNCQRCGKCKIGEILQLGERCNASISIATGGTLARKVIVDKKPTVIVAVACERDLSSGIQDAYPIPVYGVLNQRPYGPCVNTQVDFEELEEAVGFVLDGSSSSPKSRVKGEKNCKRI